jgi:hypothetical protein
LVKGHIPCRVHQPEFVAYWRNVLKPPRDVMTLLEEGYSPSLTEWPPSSMLPNNASARDQENLEFIDEEISYLLRTGAVE